MLKTKDDIENWLNKMDIRDYEIADNLAVSVFNSVFIGNKELKTIPVKFDLVTGSFDCSNNQLISLFNCPNSVSHFYCHNNQLSTLEYITPHILGKLHCFNNPLTTLKYFPTHVDGDFFGEINYFKLKEYLINLNHVKQTIFLLDNDLLKLLHTDTHTFNKFFMLYNSTINFNDFLKEFPNIELYQAKDIDHYLLKQKLELTLNIKEVEQNKQKL